MLNYFQEIKNVIGKFSFPCNGGLAYSRLKCPLKTKQKKTENLEINQTSKQTTKIKHLSKGIQKLASKSVLERP